MTNINIKQTLTIDECKNYCKYLASKYNYKIYEYFYNNDTHVNDFVGKKFAGNVNIYEFKFLEYYARYRKDKIVFKLVDANKIIKDTKGYLESHKELTFHLALKGFSFLYICEFRAKPVKLYEHTSGQLSLFPEQTSCQCNIYIEDDVPDYGFFYQDDPYLSKTQF
jgi:hypothetical protein